MCALNTQDQGLITLSQQDYRTPDGRVFSDRPQVTKPICFRPLRTILY